MTRFDFKEFEIPDLLRCFADILDDLQQRKVVRTLNNPVADYAEWLVSKRFGLSLERNSKAGYDGIDKNDVRYQIKSRRLISSKGSRQLSVIRNLSNNEFEYLIGSYLKEILSSEKHIRYHTI